MKTLLKNTIMLDSVHDNIKGDVLVENGLIAKTAESIIADKVTEIIDLGGHTLLPGFTDAHVHVAVDSDGYSDRAIKAWAYNGVSTVRELGMLCTQSGESFIDVIRAGTINAAKVCRIDSEEGTIEQGKRANLIAVASLDDSFTALGSPCFVMNRGKILRNSLKEI